MQVEVSRDAGSPPARLVRDLVRTLGRNVLRWFDTGPLEARDPAHGAEVEDRVEWSRIIPFVGMHLA